MSSREFSGLSSEVSLPTLPIDEDFAAAPAAPAPPPCARLKQARNSEPAETVAILRSKFIRSPALQLCGSDIDSQFADLKARRHLSCHAGTKDSRDPARSADLARART